MKKILTLISFLLLPFTTWAQVTQQMAEQEWKAYQESKAHPSDNEDDDVELAERNVLQIRLDSKDQMKVLTSEEQLDISLAELKEFMKYFLYNPDLLDSYPEKTQKTFKHIGEQEVLASHMIFFSSEVKVPEAKVHQALMEIVMAYLELRNEIAQNLYEKDLQQLDAATQEEIKSCYPFSVDVSTYDESEE